MEAFMYLKRTVAFILFFSFILLPGLSLSAPRDVEGWQKLKWGDDINKIKEFYEGKIKEPTETDKYRFPADEERDVAYVMRNYKLSGINFDVYFFADQGNKLCGVILLTNADDYVFKSDFEYVENILKKEYGAPSRSGDHSFKDHLYYRRIWSFRSSNIELTYFYDKEAVNFVSQPRLRLTTSGIFKTNLQILYYKNEKSDISKLSGTVQEAMARAEKKGKLAEGKFLYEMTLSDDSVFFSFDKSDLSDQAKAALDDFADGLNSENKNAYLEIQGHTDNIGSAEYNLKLGQARTEQVMHYLNMDHGIPLNRISTTSYGESRPIADNNTPGNRAKNRRVTIVVMK
jgi:peptidoglycan-associated lipoprotein